MAKTFLQFELESQQLIEWPDPRCIVCALRFEEEGPGSRSVEHIIPEALSGTLISDILCHRCNRQLGTTVDARLREDARIRFRLGVNPGNAAFDAASRRLSFKAKAGDHWLDARLSDGQLQLLRKQPDGVLVLTPTDDAPFAEYVRKRSGLEKLPSSRNLRFDQRGELKELDPITEIWPIASTLATTCIDGVERLQPGAGTAVLKIAYEFLAVAIGPQILHDATLPLRESIARDRPTPHLVEVESLMPTDNCDDGLVHRLRLAMNKEGQAEVWVCLFGNCVWRLAFPMIRPTPRSFREIAYECDLRQPARFTLAIEESAPAWP